tara:strand:- start:2081 stop:3319 length:1239 start_codon:yes stop_codon:yes gene_type:complete
MQLNLTNFHHGIGSVGDLPIPFQTVLNVSAWVIVLTFVFLKVSWKQSVLIRKETVLDQKQPLLGKIFGFIILTLLIFPGLVGNEGAKTSITPLILWVFLWIGIPVLGLIFGDIYAKFNPLAIFPSNEKRPSTVWFASVLFLGLTWFELVWRKPGNPTHIGIVFIVLLLVTTVARIFFGKASIEVDPLHLLHHLYAKLRFTVSRPIYKNMLENIANLSNFKGMEYFILLMIGTVTYDGLRGTTFWYNLFGSSTLEISFSTLAFLSINIIIISSYRFACWFALKVSGEKKELNEISLLFAHTMLPIAFAYHVTHYLSLLLYESQTILYRLNDPYGIGWNLFGVEEISVNYFLTPVALWGIQVFVTLAGHMLSVVLAHDLAIKLFGHQQSDKTQYIFLLITVGLTLQALFVLSVP